MNKTYKYLVRTKDNKPEAGTLQAQSEDELIAVLQSRGLTVVTVKEVKEERAQLKVSPTKQKMHRGVKITDLSVFARQLRVLLNAGITLLRSLEIISVQIESIRFREVVEQVKKDISGGNSLKVAIARHPKVFSKLWVNMIETGETTGQLPLALEQLIEYLESVAALQRKVISALIYPSIILIVSITAISVFVLKIIPMFNKIYSDFNAELPIFTTVVFTVCMNLKKYLLIFVALIMAIAVSIYYYRKSYVGRRQTDRFILSIYIVGPILKQIAAVRFTRGFSMLIRSGTPILRALDITIMTSGNVLIKEMLQRVKQCVREGKGMAGPLLEAGIFPDMIGHMVSVGEESGELADMLESAGRYYAEVVDASVTRLATLFEPILIVLIGMTVGLLVIAMFLPIFGLTGIIG